MSLLSGGNINFMKNLIEQVRVTAADKTVYYYKYDPIATEKDPLYDESRNKAYETAVELGTRLAYKQPQGLTIGRGGFDFDYDIMMMFTRDHLITKGLDILVNQDTYENAHELFIHDKFEVDGKPVHVVKIIPGWQLNSLYQSFCVFGVFRSEASDLTQMEGTWMDIERVTENASDSMGPFQINDIAGDIRILFLDDRVSSVQQVYSDQRKNGSWTDNVRVTSGSEVLEAAGIVDVDDLLHLVWIEQIGSVYYMRYSKYDQVIPDIETLKTSTNLSTNIRLLQTEDEIIHLTWQVGNDLYYQNYTDDEWGDVESITNLVGDNINPSIVSIDNDLVITWQNDNAGNSNIYYAYYLNDAWIPATALTTSNSAINPNISVPATGSVYIVYEDNKTGNSQVYLKYYVTSWSSETRITVEAVNLVNPQIGVSASGNSVITYRKSADIYAVDYISTVVSAEYLVSSGNGFTFSYQLLVDPQGIPYIIWENSEVGNFEIYFRTQGAR